MPLDFDKTAYDELGFTVIRQFLDAAELEQLRQNVARYVRDIVPTLADSEAFYQDRSRPETLKQLNRMGRDAFFHQLTQHPQWTALAQSLLGEVATADQPEWFNKPPGTNHVTPPHQDNYYFCLAPASVVTIWLALDNVDAENGCLRYVAGSHRSGFRSHSKSQVLGFSQGIDDYSHEDFTREVAVPLRAGDAVAHHGMTIHRADANLSQARHRRSLAIVYKGQSCRRDEAAFARYLASARDQHQALGLKS
ncbi:MAG: phytanoyl-CoA dioxygenase family protein [Aureliella sp.]